MKYKSLVVYTFFLALFFPAGVVHAATYGSSTYGSGTYGNGTSTTTTTSSETHTNTTFTPTCSGASPSSAPNLFQVDRSSTKATLYFAPAGNPNNHYVIAYGPENNMIYGVKFDQSPVPYALTYTVNLLDPKTGYAFRIRGGNGCATGEWSSTVVTRKNTVKNRIVSYYPGFAPRIKYIFAPLTKSQPVATASEPKKVIKGTEKTSHLKSGTLPKQVNVLALISDVQHWFDSLTNLMKDPT